MIPGLDYSGSGSTEPEIENDKNQNNILISENRVDFDDKLQDLLISNKFNFQAVSE